MKALPKVGMVVAGMGTMALTNASAIGLPDLFRLAIMVVSGFTGGMMALVVWKYSRLNIDRNEQLFYPLVGSLIGYWAHVLIVMGVLLERWRTPLTWLTPAALVATIITLTSVMVYKRRISRALATAHKRHTTVKMTIVDTAIHNPQADLLNEPHHV